MDLQQVKTSVVDKKLIKGLVVFICKNSNFVPLQYLGWYRKNNIEVEYVEDILTLRSNSNSLFGSWDDTSNKQYVFSCEVFELPEDSLEYFLKTDKNIWVICSKVSDSISEQLKENIVTVPKLENWQIEDLAYSMADGADPNDIQYILKVCGKDINRLYSELEKISLFTPEERKSVVKDFIYDGIFNDLSRYSIFDISSCIVKRDITTLKDVYSEIGNIECDPLGLVGILTKNFKDIISVQCTNNPTPEGCGLDTKKFWAVKYSCGYYTREQLIKIYGMLTSIDKRLKTGELTTDIIVDYVLTYILNL